MDVEPVKFEDYLKTVKESNNPVAALVWAFERLHTFGKEDQDGFGRMGQIWKLAHKDTGYVMKIIWISAAEGLAGSHLNYIQRAIQRRNNFYATLPTKCTPLKKPGHAGLDVMK